MPERESGIGFVDVVERASQAMEGAGVAIIVLGAAIATVRFLAYWRRGRVIEPAYRDYRRDLARAILLGLEFLIAGDIIRTVAIDPSFRSAGILAIIVAIRTFLSLELELEIEGRWPWQRDEAIGYRLSATGPEPAAGAPGSSVDYGTGATELAAPTPRTEDR